MRCVPEPEFLRTAVFPVALDPAVYTQNQSNAIQDAYVRSLYPNNNYSASTENWVASNTSFGTVHSYLKVDTLPSISAANYITKAYLCLSLTSKPSEDTIAYLSEVTSPFSASTITYNTLPTKNSLYQDYIISSDSLPTSYYYQFDVTSLVRKWYLGDNYGVVLTHQSENPNSIRFWSKEGTRPPYLVVNYNSMAGLESFLTYDERSLGRAGTGHVSLYNGNLIFTHGDTSENGNLMPVSVSHVYNSCDAGQKTVRGGEGAFQAVEVTSQEYLPMTSGAVRVLVPFTQQEAV